MMDGARPTALPPRFPVLEPERPGGFTVALANAPAPRRTVDPAVDSDAEFLAEKGDYVLHPGRLPGATGGRARLSVGTGVIRLTRASRAVTRLSACVAQACCVKFRKPLPLSPEWCSDSHEKWALPDYSTPV